MWCELEVPLQLSRVGIEREETIRIKIVAGAHISIPVRARISGAPVDYVQIRIVRAGHPGCRRSRLPTIAGPRFVARFPFGWNGPEAPCLFARICVIGIYKTADPKFAAGNSDLVLGGTFSDLPYAQRVKLPRGSLRFDPASGLFGLVPSRSGSVLGDVGVRQLLSEAIDRDALVDALRVPGLAARTTVLEPGLDGLPNPAPPPWAGTALADRRASLVAESARQFGQEKPTIRIYLPEGPGSDILFNRLMIDWGAIGVTAERSKSALASDLKLIDAVAPSTSPAWFLRQFRCQVAPLCDAQADELLGAARDALVPAQRYALLGQAAARIDDMQLFIPLAAPVRWSLVSGRIQGFAGNRFARHTLTDLEQKLSPGTS